MVLILIIIMLIILRMYLLTNVITMLVAPFSSEGTNAHAQLIPRGYTNKNGVQFEIKSLPLLRLSSFMVSEDIISILVDQNFTMNAMGMVLESL